ncbi:MAG: PEP-CTERM sorting domain-containing protein, partial [Planctomycetota bacterium]
FGTIINEGEALSLGTIAPAGLDPAFLAADLVTFFTNTGAQPPVPNVVGDLVVLNSVIIPEPATLSVVGLALAGFAGLRRRS